MITSIDEVKHPFMILENLFKLGIQRNLLYLIKIDLSVKITYCHLPVTQKMVLSQSKRL